MGVSGLARWVDEHAPDATPFAGLPAGSRLLIDGHGACFFMLREAGTRARAGDYAALARAFTALLTNLQSAGMVPEIFLDGPATRLKAATLDSRAAERRRRLEDVQAACLDGRTLAAAQLPEPPLMVELLAQCAEAEGVRLTRCDGEADAEVACECAAAEATRPGLCFVVAEDSDFFLFRGIRYVRFSDLLLLCGGGGGGGGGQGLRLCERQAGPLLLLGRVWTRQLLCEASGLSAGRLVDWAGLVGNDHTSAFQLASFGSVVAESLGADGLASARPSAEAARAWLAEREGEDAPGWLEARAEPLLARALRFSRALYELDHATLGLFPPDHSHSRAVPLELMPRKGADLSSIGAAALSELADGGLGRVVARADGRQPEPCELLPQHREALKRILRGERSAVTGSALPPKLCWEDVAVAQRYQALCKLLLRAGPLPAQSPVQLFDGPSFHAFAQSHVPPPHPPPSLTPVQVVINGAAAAAAAAAATPSDAAAYGPMRAAAAAAARFCAQCERRADGAVDPEDGEFYCRRCWREWRGEAEGGGGRPRLPVDEHAAEVVRLVSQHRVSLIAGQTGCGKSSRVPQLLLEARPDARLMVAQPRRIAAHGLFERARRGEDGHLYGLRMGHGVRDEGPSTRCWYVTTGYLVRLAAAGAKSRGVVQSLTHLIIDECHERATDSDLLCLLARRLLRSHPTLRVVLMSATLHSQLFVDYFAASLGRSQVGAPLHVGERRFPLQEIFLEEVVQRLGGLPERLRKTAKSLAQQSAASAADGGAVPASVVSGMLELAPWVVRLAAAAAAGEAEEQGGAVLVFVPGMAEIEELADKLPPPTFKVVPIHSKLPFEEQLEAFEAAAPGVTKVVVATNAAESSLTLPDVDAVLDLGLHKQLSYSTALRSAVLRREWVSKASAQQRAGRTARVRPGSVYRLYPRAAWDGFAEHDAPQMCREPLEASVLRLRKVIEGGQPISGTMRELLEPPDPTHVGHALHALAQMGMLQVDTEGRDGDGGEAEPLDPLDIAPLTATGRLASALPLEPQLSRMVALGIRLGCAAEALVIAAGCAQPRSPFRIVSPLVAEPDEYNSLVRAGFYGRLHFDRGMYSEPLSFIALVVELEQTGEKKAADEPDAEQPAADGAVAAKRGRGGRSLSARAARFCTGHGIAPKQACLRRLLSRSSHPTCSTPPGSHRRRASCSPRSRRCARPCARAPASPPRASSCRRGRSRPQAATAPTASRCCARSSSGRAPTPS